VENTPYGICIAYGRDPNLINNIIYDNGNATDKNIYSERGLSGVSASYCCIEGGWGFAGIDNISCDPCFRNPDANDYHLRRDSNCIDAGDSSLDYEDERDIDGHCRVMFGKTDERVDIGADEYEPLADYNGDLIVNFFDFANLVSKWRQTDPNISLDNDNDVDIFDLERFCDDWLWIAPCSETYLLLNSQPENIINTSVEYESLISIENTPVTNENMVSPSVIEEPAVTAEPASAVVEVPAENQQQSMLAGEGETAGVWLVYDSNTTPDYNEEVTVYIHSDPMLFCMGIIVQITGDANFTGAMSEADCNSYGWDNGWNSDPYIDPAGWLYAPGVSWEGTVNNTIGYFKFRYYSGEVTLSIAEDSCAYDVNCAPVLLSGQPLILGSDPNG
jgi:hypothetical protein